MKFKLGDRVITNPKEPKNGYSNGTIGYIMEIVYIVLAEHPGPSFCEFDEDELEIWRP